MPNTTIYLLLCLLSCHAAFSQSEKQDVEALLSQSIDQWDSGNFLDSRQSASRAFSLLEGKEKKALRAALNYQLARVELEFGYFAKADSLLKLAAKAFKKSPTERARVLSMMGYSFLQQAKYAAADSLLALAATLQEKTLGKSRPDYATTLDWMGLSKFEQRKPEEAKSLYEKAKAIRFLDPGESSLEYAVSLDHLAEYYLEGEQADSAFSACRKAHDITKNHPLRNRFLNTLGRIFLQQGEFFRAIDSLDVSLRLQEKFGVTLHPHYAKTLLNKGDAEQKLGNKEAAIHFYQRSLDIHEKAIGTSHPDWAIAANNLAELLKNINEHDALLFFEQAASVFQQFNHTDNYLTVKINIAVLQKDMGNLKDAMVIFDNVLQHPGFEKVLSDYVKAYAYNHYATILWTYSDDNQFHFIDSIIQQGERFFLRSYSVDFPNYLDFADARANISEANKDLNMAATYFERNCQHLIKLLQTTYPMMSEKERLSFFADYGDYFPHPALSFAKRNPTEYPGLNKSLLEWQAASKGASLQINIAARLQEKSEQDTMLIRLSEEYREVQKQLVKNLFFPNQQKAQKKIYIDSLTTLANNLEKMMSRQSAQLGALFKQIKSAPSYDSLHLALNVKEALVDFVRMDYFDPATHRWGDSYYCTLIIRKDLDFPAFIPLSKVEEVIALLSQSHPSANGSYINSVPVNREVYTRIWQPLEAYLDGVERIYLCPEGGLHQLAFHALYADDEGKTLLGQKHDIRYRLSPGDILNPTPAPANKHIALLGGALFDNLPPMPEEKAQLDLRSIVGDSTRGSFHFRYLPGTQSEVLTIADMFNKHNWRVTLGTGTDASEQNFRSLCDQGCPSVVHLATHGKYFKQKAANREDSLTLEERIYSSDQPMMRSLVALSGANVFWKSSDSTSVESDGILTALEISNMDFSGVDLVVLSACETGIGDVLAQEGVFGLQRAFKLAGVKSVLVSLWKVPDQETAELMQAFYSYYFKGDSAADALRKAQSDMSNRYTPYYWAAFVLVE